jgi:hypothetical protein
MDVLDAAYRTVHGYPGGAVSLAPRMGKSPTTLCHEVRPPTGSSAKFGLLDAIAAIEFSQDYSIWHAGSARFGGMFIKLDVPIDPSTNYGQRMSLVAKEFGELMAEVSVSTADGAISTNELRRIESAWGELMGQGQNMLAFFKAQHDEGQGRHG